MELSKNICDKLLQGLNNIELVKDVITDLLQEYADLPGEVAGTGGGSTEALVEDLVRSSEECVKVAQAVAACSRVTVPWPPESCRGESLLSYLDGQYPWAFWLSLPVGREFSCLQTNLNKALSGGSLHKLKKLPDVGTYVICVEKKAVYRGLVLSTMSDRLKILNIDTSNTRIMKLENIYRLPKEYCHPCAQTVQCSLIEQSEALKKVWNTDLCDLFKSTLRECALTVKFVEAKECFPCRYSVEVTGCNKPIEKSVNINEWLELRLVPELMKLYEDGSETDVNCLADSVLDPYSCDEVGRLEDVPNGQPWSSALISANSGLVPFACYGQLSEKTPRLLARYTFYAAGYSDPGAVGSVPGLLSGNLPLPGTAIPSPLWDLTKAVEFVPSRVSTRLNADSPSFEPQRKNPAPTDTKGEIKESIPKVEQKNVEKDQPSSNICEMYAAKGYCLKSSCSKTHVRAKKDKQTSKVEANFVDGVDDDDDDDFEDDPSINGGYNPTDESRICQFFAKDGKCWKLACRKEHKTINPYKNTNDKIQTSQEPFNVLTLPEEGSVLELKVTSVLSCTSFYAQLPDKYSDIGEYTESFETIDSLMKDLNSFANMSKYRCLDVHPGSGEIILGRSQDSKWKRVRVMDVTETQAQVCCIDYGTFENISFQDLRQADLQFLHLPSQAVLCHLDSIHANEEVKFKGRHYLESMILNKILTGKVEYVNHEDQEIYITLTEGKDSINNMMVTKGFCDLN